MYIYYIIFFIFTLLFIYNKIKSKPNVLVIGRNKTGNLFRSRTDINMVTLSDYKSDIHYPDIYLHLDILDNKTLNKILEYGPFDIITFDVLTIKFFYKFMDKKNIELLMGLLKFNGKLIFERVDQLYPFSNLYEDVTSINELNKKYLELDSKIFPLIKYYNIMEYGYLKEDKKHIFYDKLNMSKEEYWRDRIINGVGKNLSVEFVTQKHPAIIIPDENPSTSKYVIIKKI